AASGAAPAAAAAPPALPEAVEAVAGALDQLLAAQLWRASEGEVRDAVLALEVQAARLDAARLRLLAVADERGLEAAGGGPSTADWLCAATTTRAEHARRRVTLAVDLQGPLAATGKALAAGAVTAEQAGVIAAAMGRLHPSLDADTRAEAQTFLIAQAAHLDPRRLAYVGRHLTARLDPGHGPGSGLGDDLARTEARQARQAQLRCTQTDDGTWALSGLL
ncbi:DUF222 domain-containing protein, partial [Pseudokineococcus sp. 1T1Z-3]|uniref:DUF222 domain-containing protein n=1 Tax=Pseudokineococcus sp. 1T1Z-3 TaxID=3132745 RepID=UPI0030B6C6DB